MKFKDKIIVTSAMTFLVVISVTIVFGGVFLGLTGFFSLIGVTYDSIGTLLLFVLYCVIIGVGFEILEIIILFYVEKTNLQKNEKFFWVFFIKFALTWIVIHTVNEFMTAITLSVLAEVLTSLLIVSVDILFDDKSSK